MKIGPFKLSDNLIVEIEHIGITYFIPFILDGLLGKLMLNASTALRVEAIFLETRTSAIFSNGKDKPPTQHTFNLLAPLVLNNTIKYYIELFDILENDGKMLRNLIRENQNEMEAKLINTYHDT